MKKINTAMPSETIPPAPFGEDELSGISIVNQSEKNGYNTAILDVYDRMKAGALTPADVLKMFIQ